VPEPGHPHGLEKRVFHNESRAEERVDESGVDEAAVTHERMADEGVLMADDNGHMATVDTPVSAMMPMASPGCVRQERHARDQAKNERENDPSHGAIPAFRRLGLA